MVVRKHCQREAPARSASEKRQREAPARSASEKRQREAPAKSASEKRQRKAPAKSASDQRQRVHRESTQRGFSRLVSAGRGFLGSAVEKICVRHLSRRGVALQDGVVSCHRSA